jgi:hypothetical protein
MAQQVIGIGTTANDGTGDPLRTAYQKINANEAELYGQGQPNYTTSGSRFWSPNHGLIISGSAAAPGIGTMKLFPGFIGSKLTIGALGSRVSTLSASGNFQLAVYASQANGYPTGTPLGSTGNISTGAAGFQSGAASMQLGPGLFWWAENADNATVVFNSFGTSGAFFPAVIGVLAGTNGVAAANGLTIAQTFGTWPDLTSTAWTSANENTLSTMPISLFQISSIP